MDGNATRNESSAQKYYLRGKTRVAQWIDYHCAPSNRESLLYLMSHSYILACPGLATSSAKCVAVFYSYFVLAALDWARETLTGCPVARADVIFRTRGARLELLIDKTREPSEEDEVEIGVLSSSSRYVELFEVRSEVHLRKPNRLFASTSL